MRWLVTRHPGTLDWARQTGLAFDRHVEHLDPRDIRPGDIVMGSLPIHLAAKVCAQGARYFHVVLPLARTDRGSELSAEALLSRGVSLQEYEIRSIPSCDTAP